jgi:hypothetical protein
MIYDDGNFYGYNTGMIQDATIYYIKKHVTKLHVIKIFLYVHLKLIT